MHIFVFWPVLMFMDFPTLPNDSDNTLCGQFISLQDSKCRKEHLFQKVMWSFINGKENVKKTIFFFLLKTKI